MERSLFPGSQVFGEKAPVMDLFMDDFELADKLRSFYRKRAVDVKETDVDGSIEFGKRSSGYAREMRTVAAKIGKIVREMTIDETALKDLRKSEYAKYSELVEAIEMRPFNRVFLYTDVQRYPIYVLNKAKSFGVLKKDSPEVESFVDALIATN